MRATRHVPSSLKKALDALDKDAALREALGPLLVDALVFLKRDEATRLEKASVDEIRISTCHLSEFGVWPVAFEGAH